MLAYHEITTLIVDDDKITRDIIRKLLCKIGFKQIDEAPDGLTALVKMSEQKVGLVLSDCNMEPMNGLELLRQVRSDDRFAATRFILMTAAPNMREVIAARTAGVNNYVCKPFTAAMLKGKIDWSFAQTASGACKA